MSALDAETEKVPDSPVVEKSLDQALARPPHSRIASLAAPQDLALERSSEPNSETSSIAPDDEDTLAASTPEVKHKAPRKLIEDEKRARGRIAWSVWTTYFQVSTPVLHLLTSRRSAARSGVRFAVEAVLCLISGMFFGFGLTLSMIVPVASKGWLEWVTVLTQD